MEVCGEVGWIEAIVGGQAGFADETQLEKVFRVFKRQSERGVSRSGGRGGGQDSVVGGEGYGQLFGEGGSKALGMLCHDGKGIFLVREGRKKGGEVGAIRSSQKTCLSAWTGGGGGGSRSSRQLTRTMCFSHFSHAPYIHTHTHTDRWHVRCVGVAMVCSGWGKGSARG